MLSGRLPHAIDAWDNGAEFLASIPTMAHYLRAVGYRTILCGKMHFVGPDQLHGFEERLTTDVYPADFVWTPDWRKGPTHRPTGVSMRPILEAGPAVRTLQIDYDDEVEAMAKEGLQPIEIYERIAVKDVQLGTDVHELAAGDSVHYQSSTPHRVSNPGDEIAELHHAD